MRPADYERFERTAQWMEEQAGKWGLSPFPMRYEICPADVVYSIAGFGMPTRFVHWSFGKHYHRQKIGFDYGMSRIYELVVNSDPCYAFFLDSNTILQNEMIVAHVLGHSDFFRNNGRFRHSNRQMVETMAATAERFESYEQRYGVNRVEALLDSVLAIAEHVDPSFYYLSEQGGAKIGPRQVDANSLVNLSVDLSQDLLLFLMAKAKGLEDWERDVIASVREEMLYFWPQIETKIMNEGWATYWHTKFMQTMDLSGEDAIEFAKMTAQVTQPNRFQLNPYNVGLAIWEDIERRYGKEEMFIVRESDSDSGFLRNYLTQEIVDRCDLYLYEQQHSEWVVVEKDVKVISQVLLNERVHGGFPVLRVNADQTRAKGTLELMHLYEGVELDEKYIQKTLPHVARLWGDAVSLETTVNKKKVKYVFEGGKTKTVAS
ncbi:SpoVR family protein [Alicyclobacillus sp. SO9]|uniref:SpoVR family protein n=1 Tax=Alicyclobacillus sp. SO9 TaxID=2665646 RepID=UPI0018E71020|nr:SpoVR family protein [Alicyclobacillus sp. SO9]QQE80070.1 SpoVR family protein [Alicyclobacillus sp. SO9]